MLLFVVIVVVVVVVVVMVIVIVVSLVVFPFPFIAFPDSCSPTLNCLLDQFTGHVDCLMQGSPPIHDTSRPVRGNDCCKLQYHLLSESESKALVPSFGFQLLGSIQWSS
ncbi:hypothetical protein Tco_1553605 [Tanacetum coccineum]